MQDKKDLKDIKSVCSLLLSLLGEITINLPSQATPKEHNTLQQLVNKAFLQASSVVQLTNGTPISTSTYSANKVDIVSIYNITRSLLETYAAFHHLFISPENEDVQNFRLWYSMYRGLTTSMRLVPETNSNQELHAKINPAKDYMLNQIQNTQHYQALIANKTPKQLSQFNRNFLEGHFEEFRKNRLIKNAGVPDKVTDMLYGFLSDHSHAGHISIFQTQRDFGKELKTDNAKTALGHFILVLILFIKGLVTKYPEVQKVLDSEPQFMAICEAYLLKYTDVFSQ